MVFSIIMHHGKFKHKLLGVIFIAIFTIIVFLCHQGQHAYIENVESKLQHESSPEVSHMNENVQNSFKSENLPSFEDNWDMVQMKRKEYLRKGCIRLHNETEIVDLHTLSQQPGTLHNILVDDIHEALYCYIPKIACTEWKRLFMAMTGKFTGSDLSDIPHRVVHYQSGLKALSFPGFSNLDILSRMENYTKFLVVRDPLERLFSAYRDKFVANTSDAEAFRMNYGKNILKNLYPNRTDFESGRISLEEFLTFLSIKKPKSFQEHWQLYNNLCLPCTIDYNYIGEYETLEVDSNQILRKLKFDKIKFPHFQKSKTQMLLQEELKKIKPTLIKSVQNTFYEDYILFGYEIT